MKRCLIVTITASACVVAFTTPAAASQEEHVPAHQHYVQNANGDLMPVGPNSCENGPSLQFDNFHTNVHKGEPGTGGRDRSPRHDDPAVTALRCSTS